MENTTGAAEGDASAVSGPAAHDRHTRKERLILDATREVLAEGGVHGLTIEGAARRAGVGKTTIYRRYRSRTELALAVLLDQVAEVAQPDIGDTRAELVALVDRTVELLHDTLTGRVMQGLVSEIAADPELAHAYRERVVERRLLDVRHLVERGVHRGDLRPDLDPGMVADLLLGPVYHRFLISGVPMDQTFGSRLVSLLLPGFGPHNESAANQRS